MQTLETEGFKAFVVGGAVRDTLLGKVPKDVDVATDAKPEQVVSMFEHRGFRVVPTGLQHGTVTVVDRESGTPYEVTTFRVDGVYTDGRRPDSVQFVDRLEADLGRRDFTINAMAFDADGELVDPFGGHMDLLMGKLRAVGEPKDRFMEDALRVVRAMRFAAQLDFTVDSKTFGAMADTAVLHKLKDVARERMTAEMKKAFAGAKPSNFFRFAFNTGAFLTLFPTRKYTMQSFLECVSSLEHRQEKVAPLAFMALFFANEGATPRDAEHDMVNVYKFARDEAHFVARVLRGLEMTLMASEVHVRRLADVCEDVPTLGATLSVAASMWPDSWETYSDMKMLAVSMRERGTLFTPKLAVDGHDLLALVGDGPRKQVGQLQDKLHDFVSANPNLNDKSVLLAVAKVELSRLEGRQ